MLVFRGIRWRSSTPSIKGHQEKNIQRFLTVMLLALSCAGAQAGDPTKNTAPVAGPTANLSNAAELSAVHVGNSHSHPLRLLVLWALANMGHQTVAAAEIRAFRHAKVPVSKGFDARLRFSTIRHPLLAKMQQRPLSSDR